MNDIVVQDHVTGLMIDTPERYAKKIADMNDLDIYLASEFINTNPIISTIYAQNAPYPLPFEQTKETLVDVEKYKAFIDNSIARFRRSRAYKGYKSYLMCMGLDRCQVLGNIHNKLDEASYTRSKFHPYLLVSMFL